MAVLIRSAVAAIAVAACFSPGAPPSDRCTVTCAPATGACPGDMQCLADNFCHALDDALACEQVELVRRDRLAAGPDHACAIDIDGNLDCWGSNFLLELGSFVPERSAFGERVLPSEPIGRWVTVAASYFATCAIDADGTMMCWGLHVDGRLGIGDASSGTYAPTRVEAPGDGAWLAVALGPLHGCAIFQPANASDTGGALYCWGSGSLGTSLAPTRVALPPIGDRDDWLEVIAGGAPAKSEDYTCVRARAGEVFCFGTGLGAGEAEDQPDARRIGDANMLFQRLAGGSEHACGVAIDGDGKDAPVYCWGDNSHGQLGQGDVSPPIPFPVRTSSSALAGDWIDVTAGERHTCARKSDGRVWCFGASELGQVGVRTPISLVFNEVADQGVVAIAAGRAFNCLADAPLGGGIRCWGDNRHGQLGRGVFGHHATPQEVVVPDVVDWIDVSAGDTTTCAVGADASGTVETRDVYCWGLSDDAIPGFVDAPAPLRLTSGAAASVVGVTSRHACASLGGRATCWGRNAHGALGNGRIDESEVVPLMAATLPQVGAAEVAVGDGFTCVRDSNKVSCWGRAVGLGDGTMTDRGSPMDVPDLTAGRLAAGRGHACTYDLGVAQVECWGSNDGGQVDAAIATDPVWTPMAVTGIDVVAYDLMLGDQHTCANLDGFATPTYCWGSADNGELGLGEGAMSRVQPTQLLGVLPPFGAGDNGTCSNDTNNIGLLCWGAGSQYMTGAFHTDNAWEPTELSGWPALTNVTKIDGGLHHTCAIGVSGMAGATRQRLYCWGRNDALQLGVGLGFDPVATPVLFP